MPRPWCTLGQTEQTKALQDFIEYEMAAPRDAADTKKAQKKRQQKKKSKKKGDDGEDNGDGGDGGETDDDPSPTVGSAREHVLQQLVNHVVASPTFAMQRIEWNGEYIQTIRGMKIVNTAGGGVHVSFSPLRAMGRGTVEGGGGGGGGSSGGGGDEGESMLSIRSRLQAEKSQFFAT